MHNWHTDTIVVLGMMIGLLFIILAADFIAIINDDMRIVDLGKEITIGLFGFIGGGATQGLRQKDGGEKK